MAEPCSQLASNICQPIYSILSAMWPVTSPQFHASAFLSLGGESSCLSLPPFLSLPQVPPTLSCFATGHPVMLYTVHESYPCMPDSALLLSASTLQLLHHPCSAETQLLQSSAWGSAALQEAPGFQQHSELLGTQDQPAMQAIYQVLFVSMC